MPSIMLATQRQSFLKAVLESIENWGSVLGPFHCAAGEKCSNWASDDVLEQLGPHI